MTLREAIMRANAALDWIEARQGPLKPDGYARVEATVAEVRAWGQAMSDDERISEIADHWYSGERAREDVRYLLARVDALTAERDEWKRINQSDNQCAARRLEQAESERDALAARLAASEAALRRSRLWLEGAEETFSASSDCGEDEDADCVRGDSYCERARDMRQGIAEIDAALAASSAEVG